MIRAKLKDLVRSIKLRTTGDSARLVELFNAVQSIAAKIRASGSIELLEADEEYIALVFRLLAIFESSAKRSAHIAVLIFRLSSSGSDLIWLR